MPLLYYFTDYQTIMSLIMPVLILVITLDLLSKKGRIFHKIIFKYFGSMLREHEKKDGFVLNGASWVLISAVLIFFIFPKILAVTSFTILIISDLAAALIGRRFGKHSLFDKSWEGTFAFFISASLVVIIYWLSLPDLNYFFLVFGILASAIAGFTEAVSKVLKIDDNISVPTSFSIVMWALHPIAANYGFPYINLM
jgi:dolichol kinase